MKRNHGYVSSTPLFLQKKGRTSSRQHGLLGTPVEGLTGMPVDTPDSDDRPQRAIPDTTQRRLEGFCLNTPLTLSQQAQQETPTLVVDQPAQHEESQQQHGHTQSGLKKQQPPQHLGPAGLPTGQGRHRLANISNLPPSSSISAAAAGNSPQQPDSSHAAVQPMATGGTTGRRKRGHHVLFQPGLTSPQPSLLAPASGSRTGGHPSSDAAAGATGAAAAWTPYPHSSQLYSSSVAGTPGSCAGDEDDGGFVLFTSQSYVRQSQPAISPSFAAGLSAAPEEEPTTTPSQDSREPRLSPSHATTTTTEGTSFDLPHSLGLDAAGADAAAIAAETAEAHTAGPSTTTSSHQQQDQQEQLLQTGSQLTAPCAGTQTAGAATAAGGSVTPGDGLGLFIADLEETTTPELELIGIMASQEGGSQQLAGAAAAAAAGGGGAGSSRAARAAGGAGGGGSSAGRAARGPGVVCEEVTAKQMLFPVFRPLSTRKCVILVRHGESTYNKQDAQGKSWSDPQMYDAPLTQRGRQQAIGARDRVSELLKKHGHLGSTLWLCSPLTRALETMTLAAPQVEALAAAQQGVGAPKVLITSMIAEHCATTGDVGRPASHLRTRFPGLVTAMSELQEVWWFNPAPEEHPNCALTGVFHKKESVDCMRRRVSEFASWLRHRPEHVVVAFGHSTFWKYFANSKTRLRNCEVMQMWW